MILISNACHLVILAKIIVAGGYACTSLERNILRGPCSYWDESIPGPAEHIEIIDLVDPNFKCEWIEKEMQSRRSRYGGVLHNQPLLFGGVPIGGGHWTGPTANIFLPTALHGKWEQTQTVGKVTHAIGG